MNGDYANPLYDYHLKLKMIVDFCEFLFKKVSVFKQIYLNNEFTRVRRSIGIG